MEVKTQADLVGLQVIKPIFLKGRKKQQFMLWYAMEAGKIDSNVA
jgi:hypothetical protein